MMSTGTLYFQKIGNNAIQIDLGQPRSMFLSIRQAPALPQPAPSVITPITILSARSGT